MFDSHAMVSKVPGYVVISDETLARLEAADRAMEVMNDTPGWPFILGFQATQCVACWLKEHAPDCPYKAWEELTR